MCKKLWRTAGSASQTPPILLQQSSPGLGPRLQRAELCVLPPSVRHAAICAIRTWHIIICFDSMRSWLLPAEPLRLWYGVRVALWLLFSTLLTADIRSFKDNRLLGKEWFPGRGGERMQIVAGGEWFQNRGLLPGFPRALQKK